MGGGEKPRFQHSCWTGKENQYALDLQGNTDSVSFKAAARSPTNKTGQFWEALNSHKRVNGRGGVFGSSRWKAICGLLGFKEGPEKNVRPWERNSETCMGPNLCYQGM